ncbi:MAG TPA: tetratricopeptide repeat protein [Allosphingosinicella sp.]|jgi:tetratricopeptide (TPR) repeat protein|nr:tetratricopeptide repeat protein [Allosphingosinicella sp.]
MAAVRLPGRCGGSYGAGPIRYAQRPGRHSSTGNLSIANRDQGQAQTVRGDGAVGVQIDGDRNVVVIRGGGTELVLGQPHKRRGIGAPADERQLLLTEWRATTLVGRRSELDSLKAWRDDGAPVALRCAIGKAGSGKTRLAIEACEEAEKEGWVAGFVAAEELARFHQSENLARWHSPKPTLVVIDDAAVSVAMIKAWLDALAQGRPEGAEKLRILLLERHAEPDSDYGWWATLKRIESRDQLGAGDLIGGARPEPLAMLAAPEERRALFAEAMRLAAKVLGKPELTPPAPGEDAAFERRIADDRLENEPLFLMMAAVVAIDRGTSRALALSRLELARSIAELERGRLKRFGLSRGLDPDGDLIAHLAACATLQRGCAFAAAKTMVIQEMEAMGFTAPLSAEKLAMLLAEALPAADGAGIDRVRPDLIGEAFALAEIAGPPVRAEADRFAIVERAHRRDSAAVIETLILCAQDLAQGAADHLSVHWLADFAERSDNTDELMQIAQALPETTLALRELGGRLAERIVAALKAGEGPPDVLASWLTALGGRLTALGRREEALEADQEALAVLREHPSANERLLGVILNNLSVSLSDLGRREEALAAAQEAAQLRRALAAARPDPFRPDLATTLNNLANRLSDLGRREEALTAAEEAVELYRALAAARRDTFTADLAGSLNNLANRLSDLGQREAALTAAQEAVELRRALAAAHPDAFTPDLAASLNNLANRLSDLGRRDEALTAAQEAVELYRTLAAARPDAFTPNLATALNNIANCLSALGRRDEALAVAQEAAELRRALAAARPDAFTPNLATSLNNLAAFLSALGRREEALAAAQEAEEFYRVLAAARPDAFTPDLAMSLNNLANFLSALGRWEEALAAAEEAVELRRALAAARPDAFTPDLATSLGAFGMLRKTLDEPAAAMASFGEALALMSRYFLALPAAHAPLIVKLIGDYLSCAEATGIEPDWALLGPIATKLELTPDRETHFVNTVASNRQKPRQSDKYGEFW